MVIDELELPYEEDHERGRHRRRRRGRASAGGKPPRKRRGRSLFAFFVAVVLLGALVGAGWFGVDKVKGIFTVPDYPGAGDGTATVQIAADDTGKDMADKLDQANVVKSAKSFVNAFEANPASKTIEVGYYRLHLHMKASVALDYLLARNPDKTLKNRISTSVTIAEGMIAQDVFAALSKATNIPVADFQNAAKDPVALGVSPDWFTRDDKKTAQNSIEGFLYPATYSFDPGTDATTILKKIVAKFNAEVTTLDFMNAVRTNLNISPFEALIAASIAQVEGRYPADMAGIARVLYNRAYSGKFPCSCLQLDSTVNYWLRISGQTPKSSKDLTNADLHNAKDPYNTHDVAGLPIGPISNPGADALTGAMNPPKNGYLYFVAVDKDGHTKFATTEAEHEANIAEAKKNGVL